VEYSIGRERSKLRWMDGMKAAVEWKTTKIEAAKICMQDRDRWRRLVHCKHL
jgi:hypothetical protein